MTAALRVPIDIARKLMRVEGATSWVVLLEETDGTDGAVERLRQALPADKFEVIPWYELADFYNKTVKLFTRQVDVVRLLIALIVILSISNTLSMAVIERTGEIGTTMALGVRRRGVMVMFLTEGALPRRLSLLGVGLGALLAMAISAVGIPMPPSAGYGYRSSDAFRSRPDSRWTPSPSRSSPRYWPASCRPGRLRG